MDRFLITGTAGFLGSNIAEHLLKNENNLIYGIDDFSSSDFSNISTLLKNERFNFFEKKLENTLDFSVDYVFHTVGCGDISKISNYYEYVNNQISNLNLILNYSKNCGSKLFLFLKTNIENEILSKLNEITELLVKAFSKENHLDCKILKIDVAIGVNFLKNDLRLIPSSIFACLDNSDIKPANDFYFAPVCITDLLNLIDYLMNNYCEENTFNLVSKYPILASQVIRKIITLANSKTNLSFENFEIKNIQNKPENNCPIELSDIDFELNRAIEYAKIKYFI